MAANTEISWCDHTFNPWEGCTKVSPGCAHCYAEARNARFGGGTAPNWGKGAPRRRTSVQNWNQVRKWDREAEAQLAAFNREVAVSFGHLDDMMEEPRRPRVFCASLADWLDDEVEVAWLADLLDLIRLTPHLDWLLLTKRPANWYARITAALAFVEGPHGADDFPQTPLGAWINEWTRTDGEGLPLNVWIGTTVEDQVRADERIPLLLTIPAKVRFLSCEPLLSELSIERYLLSDYDKAAHEDQIIEPIEGFKHAKIDWVICGGESGAGARALHPEWARSLRDQCAAAGVAFHFKQWGEWADSDSCVGGDWPVKVWSDGAISARVGKKAAGRLLDGVTHDEFPKGATS